MEEIAIVTRAGPARLLGMTNKGHIGAGADADITIYDNHEDKEQMFNVARYVIKDGNLFIRDHEFCDDHQGRVLHVKPTYDPDIENAIRPFFDDFYTIRFDNYAVADDYLHQHEIIPTGTTG